MKFWSLVFFFAGSAALASQNFYDLKMELSKNGKLFSSSRLIVADGENAMISEKTDKEENFIEVVATEGVIQNHQGILMKFIVGTIDKKGKKTILASPEVLAKENQPAQITSGSKKGAGEISLSVTAKRKTL